MTIDEALSQYKTSAEGFDSSALREVINQLIDDNVKTDFENDSYLDALILTDVMFRRSNSSVRLLTGPGLDGFLGALQSTFVKTLERLSKSGGTVKILLLSKDIPAWLSDLSEKFKNTVTIRRATATKPINHFIVCDSKMSRQEDVHPPITGASDVTAIKARVSFNETGKAEVLENHFDAMWKTVESFPINK